MSEPIQVGEPSFDGDGMTRVEFRFEREGLEDFHVVVGCSGDKTGFPGFLARAAISAERIFDLEGMA